MLNKLEVYKIWAQDDALWTPWAKPVSFVKMKPMMLPDTLKIPQAPWVSNAEPSTAVIIDLPGRQGVLQGLALASLGYRPVPLYNGVSYHNIHRTVVPVHEIENALYYGAFELRGMRLNLDAAPAFLLDSNRMTGHLSEGRFDNRWSVFAQDMPSASYLISKGINNIIVRTDNIQSDLEHILYRYQSHGIIIYKADASNRIKITVSKPSKFKKLLYRFFVTIKLRRNSAGGFGGLIPESSGGG